MAFIDWSRVRRDGATAARSAVEAALAGGAAWGLACGVWGAPEERRALALGLGSAWLASSLSAAAILVTRAERGARGLRAFWWAFGGGLALRLLVLAGLMAYSLRARGLSQPALLLSYAFGVLGFLLMEYRHIRLK